MITNEMIFYGGIAITGLTLVVSIFVYFIFIIKIERLQNQLNIEYGEEEKK